MAESGSTARTTSLRCRIGIHAYSKRTNDEGLRYLVCSRCGKESFPPDSAGPRIAV